MLSTPPCLILGGSNKEGERVVNTNFLKRGGYKKVTFRESNFIGKMGGGKLGEGAWVFKF